MKENFLFHIDHTCYCLFFKLCNKIPKKLVYPNGDCLFCFQQSLSPLCQDCSLFFKSLLLPSTFSLSCEKDLRNGS